MQRSRVLVVLGLLLAVALPYGLSASHEIWEDEGLFSYLAWGSHVTGRPYYAVGLEDKTPGIFWLYDHLQAYDQPGVVRVRLLEGGMVLATALLLFWWLAGAYSLTVGAVAAFVWVAVATVAQWSFGSMVAITEPPLVLCTTLAFVLLAPGLGAYRAPRYLGAGLALGLGFACKQVALVDLAAALLVVALAGSGLTRPQRGRALLLLLAGFGVMAAALFAAMVLTHQWAEFCEAALLSLVRGGASSFVSSFSDVLRVFLGQTWLPRLSPLLLLAAFPWLLRREGDRAVPTTRLLWIWLAVGAAAFLAAGSLYDHQLLQFAPALAGVAGLGAAGLFERWAGLPAAARTARTAVVLVLAFLPLAVLYETHLEANWRESLTPAASPQLRLAQTLAQVLPPGETIYATNTSELYVQAQRLAPTRYFSDTTWGSGPIADQVLRELRAHPPGAVVLGDRRPISGLLRAELLPGRYTLVGRYPSTKSGALMPVYLRNDLLAHAPGFSPPPTPPAGE